MSEQKLCINCRFCDERFQRPLCNHPKAVTYDSPVDGSKLRRRCEVMRLGDVYMFGKSQAAICADGALFEPKPPRPWYLRWLP